MAKSHTKTTTNGAAVASAEKPTACYALSLSLENVRCFGPKVTLDLSDGKGRPAQWTIILGENGTGKTTLLQAMVCIESVTPPNSTKKRLASLGRSRLIELSPRYPAPVLGEYLGLAGGADCSACDL